MLKSPLIILPLLGVVVASALVADWWVGLPDGTHATYVGRQACAECHTTQHDSWVGSHHDLAMDLATEQSVLGDFDNATLEHYGVTSTMFRRDGKYFIHTEGPDGQLADFEIKYVFGVEPLQQYMVELERGESTAPNEIGKVQVLRVSWDTRAKTLVLSVAAGRRRKARCKRSDALDWGRAELEPHVRKLPQHRLSKEL